MTEEADRAAERLQKVLAKAGVASRRAAEILIAEGRVTVNGRPAVLGQRADVDADEIAVDGVIVPVRPGLVYYLLNKPPDVVTTLDDPHGRPTVADLVPAEPRVHPVGRLDAATEGLLVLTNDGGLTFRLTHPRFGVEKEYLAAVRGRPRPTALRWLREGIVLDDGPAEPARVALVEPTVLRITIHEGRNRQVRRMCDAVGHPVLRLVRTRFGPLRDRSLPPGSWRPLTTAEVRALEQAAVAGPPRRRGRAAGPTRAPKEKNAAAEATTRATKEKDAAADATTRATKEEDAAETATTGAPREKGSSE